MLVSVRSKDTWQIFDRFGVLPFFKNQGNF
nr:MAG TPA: YfkB-like domain protein [Caudoviricetes sp.]